MEMKPACLFVGRFQPFHRGHMLVVEGMTKMCSRVVIAVGSTNKSGSENPFTFDERRDMIQRALQAVNIIPQFDVTIVDIPDVESDEEWTKLVVEKAGAISMVWSGDEQTIDCFSAAGIPVKEIKEVPGISGTEVRSRMKEGGDWKELVPPEVAAFVSAIDGTNRLT